MSVSATYVVRLDPLPPEEAERVADEVVRWLSGAGHVAAPDPTGAGLFPLAPAGAAQWHVGPALRALDPERGSWEHQRVLVSARRQVCHPLELWQPARCGACATPLDEDADAAGLAAWHEVGEPALTCPACGWSAPYGDWPGSGAVGAPVVAVDALLDGRAASFLQQCRDRLGGRTRVLESRL